MSPYKKKTSQTRQQLNKTTFQTVAYKNDTFPFIEQQSISMTSITTHFT